MTQSAQAWGGTRAGASAGRDGHGQKCGAARRRNSGAPGASLAPPGARPCKGYVFRNLEATNGSDPPPRRGGERGGHCGAGTKRSAANRAERLGAKAGAPPSGRSGAKRRRRRRAESGAPEGRQFKRSEYTERARRLRRPARAEASAANENRPAAKRGGGGSPGTRQATEGRGECGAVGFPPKIEQQRPPLPHRTRSSEALSLARRLQAVFASGVTGDGDERGQRSEAKHPQGEPEG